MRVGDGDDFGFGNLLPNLVHPVPVVPASGVPNDPNPQFLFGGVHAETPRKCQNHNFTALPAYPAGYSNASCPV